MDRRSRLGGFAILITLLFVYLIMQSTTEPVETAMASTRIPLATIFAEGGAVCGNGDIEETEQCDDGNTNSGDGCSASCAVEEDCYDAGNLFSFFTWSDSYGGAGEGGVRRLFNDVVDRTTYPNRVIPRMWFAAGDIPYVPDIAVSLESLNEEISGQYYPFACSAGNQNFPMFVALGNHDVDEGGSGEAALKMNYWSNTIGAQVDDTLVGLRNFQLGPDNGYDARTTYSFDYKNTHFVVYNAYYGDPNYPSENPLGCIRQPLYDWINQDLSNTTKPVKMVIGHEPAWSFCSDEGGNNGCINYGNDFTEDLLNPSLRPRPHSTSGEAWLESYGRHWGDSLEDFNCPTINGEAGRDAFWSMLTSHNVVAHFIGHTHTYSSRLVDADGPRNDPEIDQDERNRLAYGKTGDIFSTDDGVWEVDSATAHTSAGAVYVLVTVRDNRITFEAWDLLDYDEDAYRMIETWHVDIDGIPPATPDFSLYLPLLEALR